MSSSSSSKGNPPHPSEILFKSSLRSPGPFRPSSTSSPDSPSDGVWPPSTLTAEQLHHTHWTYLAEGGKNLLLRFDAAAADEDEHLHKAKGVWVNANASRALALRLVKSQRPSSSRGKSQGSVDGADIDKDATASQQSHSVGSPSRLASRPEFEASVIAPLLQNPTLLPTTSRLALSEEVDGRIGNDEAHSLFLEKVAGRIELARPVERRKTAGVDLSAGYVDVVEDLTWAAPGTEVLAVEIKPKWLFSTGDVSRYKQHRVLKSKGELTLEEYNALYDPSDLVSGDAGRIGKATKALVKDWKGGGNNLRVFLNGRAVTDAESERLQRLLSEFSSSSSSSSTPSSSPLSLCSLLAQILLTHDAQIVLRRLAHLQSSLAPVDIRSLAAWWSAQTGGLPLGQEKEPSTLSAPPTLEEYRDFVEDWRQLQRNSRGEDEGEEEEEEAQTSTVALTLRQAILGTLLSATFKDCSIFLRLGSKDQGESTAGCSGGERGTSQGPDCGQIKGEDRLQSQSLTSMTEPQTASSTIPITSTSSSSYVDPGLLGIRGGRDETSSSGVSDHQQPSPSSQAVMGHTLRLVDLDSKPLDKLGYWLALEDELHQAFESWKTRVGLE